MSDSPSLLDREATAPAVAAPPGPLPDPRAPLSFFGDDAIPAAFLARARETPDATAIEWTGGACSYAELERVSRRIAQYLNSRGIVAGQSVAILSERSASLIYCMLGVLRSGATFYVADAAYPAARLRSCMARLKPSALLVTGDTVVPAEMRALLPEAAVQRIPVAVDAAVAALAQLAPDEALDSVVDPAHSAYVMFTSGSTGEPKAVVTAHAPLVHFVGWHARHHGFGAGDRFSMLSGLSHDPVLRDIFTPLSIGATVCVPEQATLFNPELVAGWLRDRGVTVCHLTPALGEIIATGVEGGAPLPLRHLFWGGDAVNSKITRRLQHSAPQASQTNFYGATETPQAMGAYRIDLAAGLPTYPVGRGIDDVQLLLVDAQGKLCGVGELGEVYIRTPYLSSGYREEDTKTQEKFIINPFTHVAGDMVYKTGDLGRYLPDGSVALAGRADFQLKIRGYRVEPGEIQACIERVPGVGRALVIAREVAGNKALVAWFAIETGDKKKGTAAPTATDVREAVKQALPSYMVPAFINALEAFPLLPNGKIDIPSLPTTTAEASAGYVAPETDAERELAAIWIDVLQVPRVGVTESFLDLGGDSLSSLKVVMRMKKLGIPDDVARGILQGKTIRQLANGDVGDGDTSSLPPQAQSNLLVNVVRGVLALIVITEHWMEGFFPAVHEELEPYLGLLFNLATPGFVFVFGISLGYSYFPKFLKNRAGTARSLRTAVAIVGVAILIGAVAKLAIVPLHHEPLTEMKFYLSFFSVLLYYILAMATCYLWFLYISKWKHPVVGCLTLIGIFLAASKVTWMIIGPYEVTGALFIGKGLLTAKFNYWKMSSAALVGMMFGISLRRRVGPPDERTLLAVGLSCMCAGLVILFVGHQGDILHLHDGDDMRIWRWVFCAGGTLSIAALGAAAIRAKNAPKPLRTFTRACGVFGQIALPLFVLHMLALDIHHILVELDLPLWVAISLAVLAFLIVVGWVLRRLYSLYYGSMESSAPAAA